MIALEPQQRGVGAGRIDARRTVDGGKVATPAQQGHGAAWGSPGAARYLSSPVRAEIDSQHGSAAADDQLELGGPIKAEAERYAGALAQRSGDQTRPRRRTDQGEGLKIVANRPRAGPLTNNQIDLIILHRRVEVFLGRRRQTMDLVDEQNLASLQVAQQRHKIDRTLDDRPRGGVEGYADFVGDNLRERCLAKTGGAKKQDVVERLAPALCRSDEGAQIVAQLTLTDKLVEGQRPDRALRGISLGLFASDHTSGVAHRANSSRPALTSASTAASPPSRRPAAATAPRASVRRTPRFSNAEIASATAPGSMIDWAGSGGRPEDKAGAATPPALSRSSLTMRAASLCPTPSARVSAVLSWARIARLSWYGGSAERIARPSRAPTPCTVVRRRNQSRSVASIKP